MRIAHTLILTSALLSAVACDDTKKQENAVGSSISTPKTSWSAPSAESEAREPAIAIFPMKFTSTAPKAAGKVIELAADGTVNVGGEMVAKFVRNRLEDKGGKTVFTVGKDGTVTGSDVNKKARFNAADELDADGDTLTISDDGTLSSTKSGKAPITIEGFKKEGKRAAILVIGFAMFPKPSAVAAETVMVAPDGPALTIAPLKFVSLDKNSPLKSFELAADGTVKVGGDVLGKVVKNHIDEKDGKLLLAVDKDGKIVGPQVNKALAFDAKDQVVGQGGKDTFSIADDGTVSMTMDGKAQKPLLKVEGFKREARRTAELVVLAILFSAGEAKAAPSTSAGPATGTSPPKSR